VNCRQLQLLKAEHNCAGSEFQMANVDGQITSRIGQVEQWRSARGWRKTDNNGERWYTRNDRP